MHVELRIAENAGKVNIEMYVAYEGKYLNVAYMKNTYLCTFHYLLFSAFHCESFSIPPVYRFFLRLLSST